MTDENQFQRVHWDGDEYQASDDDGPDGMPLRPRGAGLSDADVELLTLAARSLGAERVEVVEGERWVNLHFTDRAPAFGWNPLLHGDDAFNLAVQLDFSIEQNKSFERSCALAYVPGQESMFETEFFEPWDGDKSAATRRVIVRAAAEIAVAQGKKQA
jgi:hypothetical protein